MTDREKAIVMAYTGITMLMGDKFDIFHKYVEEIMCRPVFTHELAICAEEIKEKTKPDFLKLCAEEGQGNTAEWLPDDELSFDPARPWWKCSNCCERTGIRTQYCPDCGYKMTNGNGGD